VPQSCPLCLWLEPFHSPRGPRIKTPKDLGSCYQIEKHTYSVDVKQDFVDFDLYLSRGGMTEDVNLARSNNYGIRGPKGLHSRILYGVYRSLRILRQPRFEHYCRQLRVEPLYGRCTDPTSV
jgi:hypothetical protein